MPQRDMPEKLNVSISKVARDSRIFQIWEGRVRTFYAQTKNLLTNKEKG